MDIHIQGHGMCTVKGCSRTCCQSGLLCVWGRGKIGAKVMVALAPSACARACN